MRNFKARMNLVSVSVYIYYLFKFLKKKKGAVGTSAKHKFI